VHRLSWELGGSGARELALRAVARELEGWRARELEG